jgi:5'-3' exonuclease
MTQEEKILYLVDGSSYIHRAFHAVRNLSNSKGLPTNAIFGFSRMLLKLLEDKLEEMMRRFTLLLKDIDNAKDDFKNHSVNAIKNFLYCRITT